MQDNKSPEFVDIKLSRTYQILGVSTVTLRMREPTVADLKIAQKSGNDAAETETTLFANICGIAPQDLNQLSLRDYKKLQTAYSVFTD